MQKFKLHRPKLLHSDAKFPSVRVTKEAYDALVDMANESGMSISKVASKAVTYAADNLEYITEEGDVD